LNSDTVIKLASKKLEYYHQQSKIAFEKGDLDECDEWLNKFEELEKLINKALD